MLLSEQIASFRTDRPSEWLMDDFAKHAAIMENELVNIRELLDSQSNKDCLGIGYPENNDCAPWPIVDEVINNITMALKGGKK